MKKELLIVLVIILTFAAIAIAYYFLRKEEAPPAPPPVQFPVASTTDGELDASLSKSIPSQDGTPIMVKDFLKAPGTAEDSINSGYYYLGYHPSNDGQPDTAPYHILFIEESSYFNVIIRAEPIGETRKSAEAYLMQELGIREAQMCNLIYTVSVPASVNVEYSSINLGFSFCPGAVLLP